LNEVLSRVRVHSALAHGALHPAASDHSMENIVSSTLRLLRRRAIHAVPLACGLSLFTLGGYAQSAEVVSARATPSQTSAAGSAGGGNRRCETPGIPIFYSKEE